MITVLTVEAALQRTCAIFRDRADRGDITSADGTCCRGAILLAVRVDELAREGRRLIRPQAGRERRFQNRLGGTIWHPAAAAA